MAPTSGQPPPDGAAESSPSLPSGRFLAQQAFERDEWSLVDGRVSVERSGATIPGVATRVVLVTRTSDRPETFMQKYRTMPKQQLGRLIFLAAALISFALSVTLWFTDNRTEGIYVGLWVPSILAFGAFWFVTLEAT